MIAGVQWVADHHRTPSVANMSLGGGTSAALDTAVREAVSRGVTLVVAAGNDNTDDCNGSPNRVAKAITVGATDHQDRRSSFSNFGTCNDLFAPGTGIPSTWHTGDTATNTLSGTSMAAPHVAGAAALLEQTTPGSSATSGLVRPIGCSPSANKLARDPKAGPHSGLGLFSFH